MFQVLRVLRNSRKNWNRRKRTRPIKGQYISSSKECDSKEVYIMHLRLLYRPAYQIPVTCNVSQVLQLDFLPDLKVTLAGELKIHVQKALLPKTGQKRIGASTGSKAHQISRRLNI